MPHTLKRVLAAALAIAAVAPATAAAAPIDLRRPDTSDAATQSQHLFWRSPEARIRTSSLAGTTSDDKQSATRRATAQEQYYQSFGQPAARPQEPPAGGSDDGTPWAIIAVGLALAFAGAGLAAGVLAVRTRRARVPA